MTTTSTTSTVVPGRAYLPRTTNRWHYVVHVDENMSTAYGVSFTNNSSDPRPAWSTVPVEDLTASGHVGHPITVVAWWADMLATFLRAPEPPAMAASSESTDEAYARGVAAAQREFDAWKASATAIAHQYADDNNLCGEFDRCMEEIGLEGRTNEYDVTVTVTYRQTITARDSDEAYDEAHGAWEDWTYDKVTVTFD